MRPMFPNQKVEYNYGLLLIGSTLRWLVSYPLKNLTAKAVCNCLVQLFMLTDLESSVT